MDAVHYGIFKLGQIWTLTDQNGARLGFPRRELAIAAIQALIAVHRAGRTPVVVTLQGPDGLLRTMLDPLDDLALEEVANETVWDILTEVKRPRHAAFSLRALNAEEGY